MGEIQRHHVTHHLSAELRALLKATVGILGKLEPPPPPAPEATSPDTDTPEIEHWMFYDPRQRCDVVAFLDADNQIRHVPANRAHEVPKTWRRVFIEVED